MYIASGKFAIVRPRDQLRNKDEFVGHTLLEKVVLFEPIHVHGATHDCVAINNRCAGRKDIELGDLEAYGESPELQNRVWWNINALAELHCRASS